jgi:integrase
VGCLPLTQEELPALLGHVKENAAHPWVYPMVCFVAHAGARRSEALRVLVQDVDFASLTVVIREKKRSHKERTARRVPLTPFLAGVPKEWLEGHPGRPALFCQAGRCPAAGSAARRRATRARRPGRRRSRGGRRR